MQLPIDTVIQPKFTQHQLQRALYSLWQARCRDGQIPLWQSLPCQAFGPYLSAASAIGLAASNRSVIRIASTQVNQLLGQDSRGQALDSLCAPAIQPQFEHLVSQVFTRQSPMSVTLRSRAFDRESVLTMLPLLDRQRQCRRALATVDLVRGQYRCEAQQKAAPFSALGPVYYAARPGHSPQETDALVLCMGRKKGAQIPARPYLKLVS